MKQEMIVTDAQVSGVCFICNRHLHQTHVVFNGGDGHVVRMHQRCSLQMAGLIIRKVHEFFNNRKEDTNAN